MLRLATLLARLKQPSSLAGIAAIAALFGVPPGVPELVGQLVGGLAGLAAIVVSETAKK